MFLNFVSMTRKSRMTVPLHSIICCIYFILSRQNTKILLSKNFIFISPNGNCCSVGVSDFNKWVTKTHVSLKLRKNKFYFFNIKTSKLTEYFLHDKNSHILHFFASLHTKFEKKSFISHDKKSLTSLNTATGA